MKKSIKRRDFCLVFSVVLVFLFFLLYQRCTQAYECDFYTNLSKKQKSIQANRQFLGKIKLLEDRNIHEYLKFLITKITLFSGYQNKEYQIKIMNDPRVNAYAVPENHIYISLGLIEKVENEDQLAGIIAHEIAHLKQEHSKKQMIRISRLILKIDIINKIFSLFDPDSERVISNSLFLVNKFVLNLYQRNNELEADSIAVTSLKQAGWNPRELGVFFSKLKRELVIVNNKSLFSSHPSLDQRIELINRKVKKENQKNQKFQTKENSRDFKQIKTRVKKLIRMNSMNDS